MTTTNATTTPDLPVLLTVRGKALPASLEEMRVLHNQTAGSPPGIAAARALGDLSHKVYAPQGDRAPKGELLFLDFWVTPQGIMEFFSNEQVIQQGTRLFSARDASVWMPAIGSFSYHLPAQRAKNDRFVGILRGPVASPAKAIEVLNAASAGGLPDARRRGLLSHEVFVRIGPPAPAGAPAEVLGIDVWSDAGGMMEHYGDQTHMRAFAPAFSGPPDPTIWQQAPGDWSEW